MPASTVHLEQLKQQWLQDPGFRAEYEALEPAYQPACLRIEHEGRASGMACVYRAERDAIAVVMRRLREDGGIAPDARFDADNERPRREVRPRDLDFLHMAEKRPLGAVGPLADDAWAPEPALVELALGRLKRNGFVAPDAAYLGDDPRRLAQVVLYRDMHLLFYLGQYAERELTEGLLRLLKRRGLVAPDAAYDAEHFAALRRAVKAGFQMPDTAISPAMERLLYMLASVRRPRRLVAMGVYCANALVWSAGAACGPGKVYDAASIWGVDIDPWAIAQARRNLDQLDGMQAVTLLTEDARDTAERLDGPLDYVYLDIGSEGDDKRLNLEVLEQLYPKLSPGAWVLAHDTTLPAYRPAFQDYLRLVRDPHLFAQSLSLDVDCLGLELSIR